jgi:tripartite ATP-independent transporter DctP family solute receptor
MYNTLNGKIGEEIFDRVAKKMGARPLAAIYLGSRVVNLRNTKGAKTPEDLKGVKLRMPNTPEWLYLGKALGANPTPLAFSELYLSLKTGTVDGQDNPLPTVKNAKFYEVTKSITLTNHVIDSVWITINEKKWEKLSKENQAIILKAAKEAAKVGSELNVKREKELVSFFEEKGLNIVHPDLAAFKAKAEKMYLGNKEISGKWDMDLYNRIQENK